MSLDMTIRFSLQGTRSVVSLHYKNTSKKDEFITPHYNGSKLHFLYSVHK